MTASRVAARESLRFVWWGLGLVRQLSSAVATRILDNRMFTKLNLNTLQKNTNAVKIFLENIFMGLNLINHTKQSYK